MKLNQVCVPLLIITTSLSSSVAGAAGVSMPVPDAVWHYNAQVAQEVFPVERNGTIFLYAVTAYYQVDGVATEKNTGLCFLHVYQRQVHTSITPYIAPSTPNPKPEPNSTLPSAIQTLQPYLWQNGAGCNNTLANDWYFEIQGRSAEDEVVTVALRQMGDLKKDLLSLH